VVASQVRNLASRSAEAAKEIKSLIQDSVGKVTEGTKLVDQSGKVLAEIVWRVKQVTDVMAEIAGSSREQASGIEQVSKTITTMDVMTQQNAALVEEASAAAEALNEQASNLMQLMARYHVGDTTVAGTLRSSHTAPAASAAAPERRTVNRLRVARQ
jgi:methyl-accepting chemotaxis protein